jgi:ATP-dependent DNA ligase
MTAKDNARFLTAAPTNLLVAACGRARRGLKGIVAKRKDAPYRSNPRRSWIKVKTSEWKTASQYRAKLFQ